VLPRSRRDRAVGDAATDRPDREGHELGGLFEAEVDRERPLAIAPLPLSFGVAELRNRRASTAVM